MERDGPDTKLTASRQGVHTKWYKALTEHIDERYKMTFGHVDLHDKKDDPMGFLSLLGTDDSDKSPATTTSSNTSHQQSEYDQHLDAFGEGKGKGASHLGAPRPHLIPYFSLRKLRISAQSAPAGEMSSRFATRYSSTCGLRNLGLRNLDWILGPVSLYFIETCWLDFSQVSYFL